ncbi:disease resistance protein RPM1-like [Oryza glaberrima]|uniref:disease resistance protein RPM1-like n=1 Tax=Oryza glaberrima TaxID=4538 RepID=UPI00224C42CE|nr:disease resistance protein RPM1-like [Oryza glaberrima]XP_052169411.1 disease resistance protein RPM1-like [Oryza glaberrima]
MAEAVILLAVKKIGVALGNETINQATSYFKKFVTQLTELQGSMGRIKRELRLMHEFLSRMDVRNRNNQTYEIWVEEVRMLVHRIEDIVDDYLHLVGHKQDTGWGTYLKKGFKRPNVLFSLNRIASSIKDAEANLVHLFQAKERWVWMAGGRATGSKSSSYIIETSRHLANISRSLDEDLVGVDENIRKLHEWLTSDELQREVIALHGMGGLGKTALAANVYRNEREKFECHAWVSISQTYSIKDVLKCLVTELDLKKKIQGNIGDMDTATLQNELKKFLMDQKYLIVLDDVWVPEAVNDLFSVFVSNLKGSRILVTTRIDGVAHLAFPDKRITLEPLSEKKSWELFCKTAFPRDKNHECPTKLTELAQQIVSKCEGLPLAIVSVGRLLFVRDKTKEEFRRIQNQLDWELINNPSLEHVRNILYLSYIYLPTHLKSCFLYCSLFPEDYLLKRKKLIRWWVAEGFVENRGGSTMEEVAEGYLMELVHRNMLELVERNPFGRIKSFRMHDIVRELAVDLCRRECFGRSYSYENKHGKFLEEKDERRLVIHKLDKNINQAISSECRSLRSLIILDEGTPSSSLLHLVADKCRYISVVDLTGLPIEKIPDAIGDLFNLRHLGLRGSKVKHLPNSIEKLSNLLTLDLCRSEILHVPDGIVKLTKLRHLFIEKANDLEARTFLCRTGIRIHKGLEKLTELQTLQGLEVQDEGCLRRLGELRQMRSIRIWGVKGSYCESLCESLQKMDFLSFLDINASGREEVLRLDGLNPLPPNIQSLSLCGRLAEAGMFLGSSAAEDQNNHSLHSMTLSWSQLVEDPFPSLSRWSNLTELIMTRAYVGEQFVFLPGWFPNLKNLDLIDMPDLKRLEIHDGAMTNLQDLTLVNLSGLIEVPSGIEFLPTLNDLGFVEITQDFFAALCQCDRIGHMQWWYTIREETDGDL